MHLVWVCETIAVVLPQTYNMQRFKAELMWYVHEVRDLPCVAFPWSSSAGVGSGPGELIAVKLERL